MKGRPGHTGEYNSFFWRLRIEFQQSRKHTLVLHFSPLFYSVYFIPGTKIPQLVFERLPCEFERVSNLEHAIVEIKLLIFFKVLLNWTQIADLRGLIHSSLAGTMFFFPFLEDWEIHFREMLLLLFFFHITKELMFAQPFEDVVSRMCYY